MMYLPFVCQPLWSLPAPLAPMCFLQPCHRRWKSLNLFSLPHLLLNLPNSYRAMVLPHLPPSNLPRQFLSLQAHNKLQVFLLEYSPHCIGGISLAFLPLGWTSSCSFFNPQNLVVNQIYLFPHTWYVQCQGAAATSLHTGQTVTGYFIWLPSQVASFIFHWISFPANFQASYSSQETCPHNAGTM